MNHPLTLNAYNLLIGFGMLQSFVFSAILLFKSKASEANRYLGLSVLFLSCYLLWVLKYDIGFQLNYPKLRFLPLVLLTGIGPAFYLYLRALFDQPVAQKQVRWHFLPLLIEWLYFNSGTLIFWLKGGNNKNLNRFEYAWIHYAFSVEHLVGLASLGIYLTWSFQLLGRQKLLFTHRKINYILGCFLLLWLIWIPYTIIDVFYYDFAYPPSKFYGFYILFAALTYTIGYLGFRLNTTEIKETILPEKATEKVVEITPEMQQLAQQIKQVMVNEKHYLDPDLNLRNFSTLVDLHPNKVSNIVNVVLEQSFRDFVNAYRVESFKDKLRAGAEKEKTMLGLAYESGFNSKASFNRIFKKHEGVTPLEFQQSIKRLTNS